MKGKKQIQMKTYEVRSLLYVLACNYRCIPACAVLAIASKNIQIRRHPYSTDLGAIFQRARESSTKPHGVNYFDSPFYDTPVYVTNCYLSLHARCGCYFNVDLR